MYLKGGKTMKLKVSKENPKGLNTEFVNIETLEHAVTQINKGNKSYENYQVVNKANGTTYIRSIADDSKKNNIE